MFRDGGGDGARDTVEDAKAKRRARQQKREEEAAAVQRGRAATRIQAVVRRHAAARALKAQLRDAFDSAFHISDTTAPAAAMLRLGTAPGESSTDENGGSPPPAHSHEATSTPGPFAPRALFRHVSALLWFYDPGEEADVRRLGALSKAIVAGLSPTLPSHDQSYAKLALYQDMLVRWIAQVNRLLSVCGQTLAVIPARSCGQVANLLHVMLTLTNSAAWKLCQRATAEEQARRKALAVICTSLQSVLIGSSGLFGHLSALFTAHLVKRRPTISSAALTAALTLCTRCLAARGFAEASLQSFCVSVLSTPALFHSVRHQCQPLFESCLQSGLGTKCLLSISRDQQALKIVFNALEGNGTLALLGNLVDLIPLSVLEADADTAACFLDTMARLLGHCRQYVIKKQKQSITTEHPILGWFQGTTSRDHLDVLQHNLVQLRALWSTRAIRLFLADAWIISQDPAARKSSKSVLRRLTKRGNHLEIDHLRAIRIQAACQMYMSMLDTLLGPRAEILGALAFTEILAPKLWTVVSQVGPKGNFEVFLNAAKQPDLEPLIAILVLACDCSAYLIAVLDQDEVYVQQRPFLLKDLVEISQFLNEFVFRILWACESVPREGTLSFQVLTAAEQLLRLLYDLDSRRAFTEEKHWLFKAIPLVKFQGELDRERALRLKGSAPSYLRAHHVLERLPHGFPFASRVRLFRDEVMRDQSRLAAARPDRHRAPYVTIRRGHILTDGFRELSKISVDQLKDVVKVKFVNEQGLDEAGIDEQGVFKEFLEESIKAAFDPEFGLFTTTADNQLYPSLTSVVHPEHLSLFHFVGRILGKACYDGILLELPFARFFLNLLLGRHNTLDELPSLDADLAKNLNFIKTYEGNMADLDLVFAVDTNVLGELVTTPLKPGGSAIAVCNENRFLYVHLMADYKLNKQLKPQADAFVKGFQSIVARRWLRWFSAPELQKLISGDTVGIDVADLKSHVAYQGGYHGSHRVVRWLWEIVDKELTVEEQGKFLKFVTSCSKAPMLGFSSLHPQFTIRAVHEGAAEDRYTLGSVLVNMFSRGTDTSRLPTSSTCFNLLKLPLYKTKRALREKLRYSISSGAGFELS